MSVDTTIEGTLNKLSRIADKPRHLISDGYDESLKIILRIAKRMDLKYKIHSFPTGYDCGTWVIPEKWNLKRAQLKNNNGQVLLDTEDEPLVVVSYSQPFEGKVTKNELLKHLYVSDNCPDAIPFVFKYYDRDWGLCCTRQFRDNLKEESYYVLIDTEFSDGELKVGEIIVEGKFEESFVIASHLCHPHQVNDGPIGIFPTMEIMSYLNTIGTQYTFRQLIIPENIGSAAWLSKNIELIPKLKGGLFVEMLGTDLPLCLNKSFKGDTIVDNLFSEIVKAYSPLNSVDPFIHANDERQFNGPGVQVPMLGLNRMSTHKKAVRGFLYYHTNLDNLKNINIPNLIESTNILKAMILAFDKYLLRPKAHFIGEPFLSRYGLHIDAFESLDKSDQNVEMMDILFMVGDGALTIYEIGKKLNLSSEIVKQILDKFVENDLISYKPL
jgi:aminopeptidase-like protein